MNAPLRGEIYVIDFGEPRGSEPKGRRASGPRGHHHAVIVQNNVGNEYSSTTTVAAITSSLPDKQYPMHVWLDARATGGECVIQCELLLTVAQDRLLRKVGVLTPAEVAKLDRALGHQLHLSP